MSMSIKKQLEQLRLERDFYRAALDQIDKGHAAVDEVKDYSPESWHEAGRKFHWE